MPAARNQSRNPMVTDRVQSAVPLGSSLFTPRKIAVLGAGAVGSYYGAMLARAGIEVTLIARAMHAAAIERDGLCVVQNEREWHVRVRAATDIAAAGDADLVLVTVKSPDTTDAMRALAPHLNADARLASLQNGVDNAPRIAAVLPHPVYATVVYVGVTMDGPGRVRHTGRGDLVIGVPRALGGRGDADADLHAIATLFESAGIGCPIAPDIEAALWTKLTLNCAFNAVSALGQSRYGRMAATAPIRAVMEEAVRETVAVARADGVGLDADELIAATWELAAAMAQQYSSTAQDVQRGKPTEIDALNGYVAQHGAQRGVPTPVNRTLHALVKLREMGLEKGSG
jgi:2-dehydropantoate 2-reductase